MFNTFNFMAINSCCILGGPYYPTLPTICYLTDFGFFIAGSGTINHYASMGEDIFIENGVDCENHHYTSG